MTILIPIIPEDSWVRISEFRSRRYHKVFATNGDVLTYCNRWLKRDRVELYEYRGVWTRCRMCVVASS